MKRLPGCRWPRWAVEGRASWAVRLQRSCACYIADCVVLRDPDVYMIIIEYSDVKIARLEVEIDRKVEGGRGRVEKVEEKVPRSSHALGR